MNYLAGQKKNMRANPLTYLYTQLSNSLQGREDAASTKSRQFSWCERGAVDAVAMPLPGAPADAGIEIWLGRDATSADVPHRIRLAGAWQDLHIKKRSRPRIQANVALAQNAVNNSGEGTIAGLMRDRLHPDRYYILSCGHVFAGVKSAKAGDVITVKFNGNEYQASLTDWEPVICNDIMRTGLDAAIARVSDSLLNKLKTSSPLPEGISSSFYYNDQITIKTEKDIGGFLKTRWSGYVDIEATERVGDYYLENAIGYEPKEGTQPGHSGAAIWLDNKNLIGIHVAAPVGNGLDATHAILCPIDRIMDWFDIEPLTSMRPSDSLIPSTPATSVRVSAVQPTSPEDELDVVAKTIWGEARGEGEEGMKAVACVIGNRKNLRWRKKDGFAAVCLDKWQFSCWNDNDPNRALLQSVTRKGDANYELAKEIAGRLMGGLLSDFTFKATHYYSTNLKEQPYWARGKEPCYQVGKHVFFNDID